MSEPWYAPLVGRDMAIDLGTANTLVYVRGRGVVLNEPSVVAVNARDGRPLAVGTEAKRMIGRTPGHIQAIRPLRDGVINDFDVCEKMIRYFIQRVHQRRFAKPRMVICVPSGVTGVEQRAVQEAAENAGARRPIDIIEEPVAAIVDAVKVTLDKTPPELAADIMGRGIVLTGGGALLHGLPERLHSETGMPIAVAENPLFSVAIGSGLCLENRKVLKGV